MLRRKLTDYLKAKKVSRNKDNYEVTINKKFVFLHSIVLIITILHR